MGQAKQRGTYEQRRAEAMTLLEDAKAKPRSQSPQQLVVYPRRAGMNTYRASLAAALAVGLLTGGKHG